MLVAAGGSNPLADVFFTTRAVFERHVAVNYVTWNMPYYFGIREDGLHLLNLQRADPPWYGYRLADIPYAAGEAGLFDKTNGELRTLAQTYRAGLCVVPAWAPGHYEVARTLDRLGILRLRAEADPGNALAQFRACVERKRRRLATRSAFLAGYLGCVLTAVHDRMARNAGHPARREIVLEDRDVLEVPGYVGRDAPRFFREARGERLPPLVARLFNKGYDLVVCRGPEARRWTEGMMRFLNYLTPVEGSLPADSGDARPSPYVD